MSETATTAHTASGGHAAHDAGHATSLGVDSRKMGVWAFIGSEVMFFTALITTYLVYKPVNAELYPEQLPHEVLGIQFTANLLPDDQAIARGEPRHIPTDNRVVVPVGANIKVLVTSSDVIHSWAMPEMGVKMRGPARHQLLQQMTCLRQVHKVHQHTAFRAPSHAKRHTRAVTKSA